MGSLTNYGENYVLNHFFGAAQTAPANVYLALATADPGEAATGASMSEVANANGYSRKAISFGNAASRSVVQDATVTFDTATGAWGTVTHWALVDSATYGSGNVLATGAVTPNKVVVSNNTPSVPSGEIELSIEAGALTDTAVHEILDHIFNNAAYTQPATYVGLATTPHGDSAAGTEVAGGAYARVLVNKTGGANPSWETVANGATQNGGAVTFATTTASWGTVVATGLYDAASGGTLLWYMNDTADQAVGSGDTVVFAAGAIDCSLS